MNDKKNKKEKLSSGTEVNSTVALWKIVVWAVWGERKRSDPEGGEKEKEWERGKGKVCGMEKQRRERVK